MITKTKSLHQPKVAVGHFAAVLTSLCPRDMRVWDVSPRGDVSPKTGRSGDPMAGTLSIETSAKGINLAGWVNTPGVMWHRLRPPNLLEAHAQAPV